MGDALDAAKYQLRAAAFGVLIGAIIGYAVERYLLERGRTYNLSQRVAALEALEEKEAEVVRDYWGFKADMLARLDRIERVVPAAGR